MSAQETQRADSKIEELLESLMAKASDIPSDLATMRSKQAEMARKIAYMRLGDGDGDEGTGPKCYYCKQRGHIADACPRLIAKRNRRQRPTRLVTLISDRHTGPDALMRVCLRTTLGCLAKHVMKTEWKG